MDGLPPWRFSAGKVSFLNVCHGLLSVPLSELVFIRPLSPITHRCHHRTAAWFSPRDFGGEGRVRGYSSFPDPSPWPSPHPFCDARSADSDHGERAERGDRTEERRKVLIDAHNSTLNNRIRSPWSRIDHDSKPCVTRRHVDGSSHGLTWWSHGTRGTLFPRPTVAHPRRDLDAPGGF